MPYCLRERLALYLIDARGLQADLKGVLAMAECNFIRECAFFNDRLHDMPLTKDFLKDMYCLNRPLTCLRLKKSETAPVGNMDNRATPLVPDSRFPDVLS